MNKKLIRERARHLKEVASNHSYDLRVTNLMTVLEDILRLTEDGGINEPIERIPGSMAFLEGGLDKYRDLARAYSAFKTALVYPSGDRPSAPHLDEIVRKIREES